MMKKRRVVPLWNVDRLDIRWFSTPRQTGPPMNRCRVRAQIQEHWRAFDVLADSLAGGNEAIIRALDIFAGKNEKVKMYKVPQTLHTCRCSWTVRRSIQQNGHSSRRSSGNKQKSGSIDHSQPAAGGNRPWAFFVPRDLWRYIHTL